MAKSETILNLAECAREFHISPAIVDQYIKAGELRCWHSGNGKGGRYAIPLSAAEAVFAPFRTALTPDDAVAQSDGLLTKHMVRDYVESGKLTRLRPTNMQCERISVYVTRESFDRTVAALRARKAAADQPALKLVAAPSPQASDDLPPDVAAQAIKAQQADVLLRLLDERLRPMVEAERDHASAVSGFHADVCDRLAAIEATVAGIRAGIDTLLRELGVKATT